MGYDPVSEDPDTYDEVHPAKIDHITFKSEGCTLIGVHFRAQGPGKKPIAVILHGFPGHERNFDLAHVLRRGGINTLIFHYRGAWGSGGDYRLSNLVQDVRNCLKFIRSEDTSNELGIDPNRIILIGHSMGGWAALTTAAGDPNIKHIVTMAGFNLGLMREFATESDLNREIVMIGFKKFLPPVNGVTENILMDEIMENGIKWNLLGITNDLTDKSLLLISADRDQLAVQPFHHDPLFQKLKNEGIADLTEVKMNSDHSFSDKRIALSRVVLDWIVERI
ncbi:MAG: alpha/beta hydrolase [Thermoplasmatota archaeon]